MTQLTLFFARRNEAANKWLDEHPMALGGGALVLGVGLLIYGIVSLKSGTTRDKYGRQMSGGSAMAMSIVRLVAGAGCTLFGLYKMIAG